MTLALVLAGGGVAGIAWETGVLQGVADVDEPLAAKLLSADTVIGTSAGSTVAAQITSGTALHELYAAQLSKTSTEIEVQLDLTEFTARLSEAVGQTSDEAERRRRIGALALATDTVAEPARRTAIQGRLPALTWPDRDLRIPAVDANSGEVVVFTPGTEVALTDAVTASSAVPGVWPPATVNGHRYIDGGVRSATNADLAQGADRVLVVTPALADQPGLWGDLTAELTVLTPARTHVVFADQASIEAFGTNPLSPHTRGPAARAGREVGRTHASAIESLLSS